MQLTILSISGYCSYRKVNHLMTKSQLFIILSLSVSVMLSPFSHVAKGHEIEDHPRITEANSIATSFIGVLPVEAQTGIGIKEKSTEAEWMASGYTETIERNYQELYKWLEDREINLSPDPLLKKEMGLVKSIVANTLHLLKLNREYGRITIFVPFNYYGCGDAIDAVSYIYEGLSSLVLQKYPIEVVGKRFAQYVEGDGTHPPFMEGVEQEIRTLIQKYKERSVLYPCLKQIENILDEKRLKSIMDWIQGNLPEEQKQLLPIFEKQIKNYEKFVRSELLPKAPKEAKLPQEIYVTLLKLHGVHDDPEQLIQIAKEDFKELYGQYEDLARQVAQEERLEFSDPVHVLQHLEQTKTIESQDEIMGMYRSIQQEIEEWIKEHQLLTLPTKPMDMRLGNEAEEAIMPVPHVNTPYFVGNDGSVRSEFVLCDLKSHGNPLVAFPLAAHEGHPGHVHQFNRMLEDFLKGRLDLIQAVVASNSTNCEGWAHYVEYLMRPYYSKAAQLGAIRDQLLRSARLFLDPQLNLGRITFDEVVKFYQEKVGFTQEVAISEAERYSYRMPAQATTYRYGALMIAKARDQLSKELGDKFSLKKFHDAFISFGLLPIDMIIDEIKGKMREGGSLS